MSGEMSSISALITASHSGCYGKVGGISGSQDVQLVCFENSGFGSGGIIV